MWWRGILVAVLMIVVFLVAGVLVSSPRLPGDSNGMWIALAIGVVAAGGLLAIAVQHYREERRLRGELDKWKTSVQGRIWRGY